MLYMFYFVPQYSSRNGRTLPHRFLPTPLVRKKHSTRLERRNPFPAAARGNGHAKDAGGATGGPQEIVGGAACRAGRFRTN
jgi:hypothetical protein